MSICTYLSRKKELTIFQIAAVVELIMMIK
jgi:hypothetical protein